MISHYSENIFVKSLISGFIIAIACSAYLSVDNKYIGGLLFSFALFCIIQFGFALFTGRVGYIPDNAPSYIFEVLTAFIGNIIGVICSAFLLSLTRTWEKIHASAVPVAESKLNDSPYSSIILGFFCGLLMYLAIENSKVCRIKNYDVSLVFGTVSPVMLFIFCGFNHCIADTFYILAYGMNFKGALYILTIAIGNSLGAMMIPLVKKISRITTADK